MKEQTFGLLLVLLLTVLWIGAASGEDPGAVAEPQAAEAEHVEPWEAVLEQSLENNADYEIAILRWNMAQIDHRIWDIRGQTTKQQRLEAELSVLEEQRAVDGAKADLYVGIVRDFAALLADEQTLEKLTNELIAAEYEEQIAVRRVEFGDLPQQELIRRQQLTSEARDAMENQQRSLQRAWQEFLAAVPGADTLVSLDFFMRELPLGLAETKEALHEHSRELAALHLQRDLADLAWQQDQIAITAPLELERAELQYTIAVLRLDQQISAVESAAEESWYDLQEDFSAISRAEVNAELAADALERTKRQFDIGLIPEQDLWDAENNVYDTEALRIRRQSSYITNAMQFMNDLGLSPWPWEDLQ